MSDTLAKETLSLFSRRAQKLLKQAELKKAPRKRETLVRLLASHGLPPFEPWIDFQMRFGGLKLVLNPEDDPTEYRFDIARGLEKVVPPDLVLDEATSERKLVCIGSAWNQRYPLYMDERGEVLMASGDELVMRNASIQTYLEQTIRVRTPRWKRPWFYFYARPPELGASLATSLGAKLDRHYSDPYSSLWATEDIEIEVATFAGSERFCKATVKAESVEALAKALDALAKGSPAARVSIGAVPRKDVELSDEEEAAMPQPESWRDAGARVRLEVGREEPHLRGPVWIVGEGEELAIHQYLISPKPERAERCIQWSTITKKGELQRSVGI